MKLMDKYYCWASDFSERTGEGNLARLFVKKSFTSKNYRIFTVNNIKILNYKYLSPFIGILFCWYLFIKRKKVVYLNYLPLWNCFLFIFLPPKIILGPITGGANIGNKQIIIRKYIFPILYKISEIFILFRKKNICFSTDLLKKHLLKETINIATFNFVFNYLKKKKKNKKKIDFLIYYRRHINKEASFPHAFLKKLISLNFKVHVFGDFFNNRSVKNYGFINNNKVNKLLSKTYFTLASNENLYTMFSLECINNHVKIIVDKSQEYNIKYFKKNFVLIDFKKINICKKKILNLKSLIN